MNHEGPVFWADDLPPPLCVVSLSVLGLWHLLCSPDVPKITDLSFINVTDSTIDLSWSPLNSTAVTGYRITVLAAGDSVPIFVEFVEPTTGFYTVHGLEPGIDYDITITTVTENGESEPITITQQTGKSVCVSNYTCRDKIAEQNDEK